ncbi:MAG: methylated-DNA--[protein]-cysteine S-methyltransferase [Eubacteriales bacterium]|nr:methylated-DNA--[protein]-cysteine S-methyltransferase [Eubacteriales bacterium]
MIQAAYYTSPIGEILLAARENALVGLWLAEQKYYLGSLKEPMEEKPDTQILLAAKNWLDRYFSGAQPAISELNLAPSGSVFQKAVWAALCEIPYGELTTYGAISHKVAAQLGKSQMSAQAVGGAVGHNPISIIIPCHRVVGTNGSLTGYAGGIDKKIWLLRHEGADTERLFIPVKSTAP